jgi:hypothetical protein
MTKKTNPPASPTRWMGTMCGCESPAAELALEGILAGEGCLELEEVVGGA